MNERGGEAPITSFEPRVLPLFPLTALERGGRGRGATHPGPHCGLLTPKGSLVPLPAPWPTGPQQADGLPSGVTPARGGTRGSRPASVAALDGTGQGRLWDHRVPWAVPSSRRPPCAPTSSVGTGPERGRACPGSPPSPPLPSPPGPWAGQLPPPPFAPPPRGAPQGSTAAALLWKAAWGFMLSHGLEVPDEF